MFEFSDESELFCKSFSCLHGRTKEGRVDAGCGLNRVRSGRECWKANEGRVWMRGWHCVLFEEKTECERIYFLFLTGWNVLFINVYGGSYNIQLSRYVCFSSGCTRSSASNLNLRPTYRFRTSLFRDSFFNRIALLWNNLPLVIRQSATFVSFKTKLYELYFNKLDAVFDTDRVRSWKTVCPHCRATGRPFCCWEL